MPKSIAHEAFTRQSEAFDAIDDASPVIKWMRQQVYRHVDDILEPNSSILELNAGTGIDAVRFAGLGHRVFATDASEGMLGELNKKTAQHGLQDKITSERIPFEGIRNLNEGPFDFVFSDFGGLNCLADLSVVAGELPRLLKPGGMVTWILISPYCLWEWLLAFKGNFKVAFRRLRKHNVQANLEGVSFPTYYFSPAEVKEALGQQFELVKLEGLATLSPPPYLDWIALKKPKFYRFLTSLDEKTSTWPVLRSMGDHFIISLRFTGST